MLKHFKNHSTRRVDLFCGKNRSKKQQLLKKWDDFEIGYLAEYGSGFYGQLLIFVLFYVERVFFSITINIKKLIAAVLRS